MMEETATQNLRAAVERFIQLPEDDWQLLVPHLVERTLKKHTLFAAEGKKNGDVGFVLEGSLRQYYTRDGEEKTTYFYFEHHLVSAYIACLSGQSSKLSIEALTDCKLLVFSYKTLTELFAKSAAWNTFGRRLAEYLAMGLEERMVGLLLHTPEERYKELLQGNKHKIIERIPQHYIASYLGITPVSLSRIRNRVAK